MGGENHVPRGRPIDGKGSSPRGRGKLGAGKESAGIARLIPAWAGKTLRGESSMTTTEAHPRVGGENFVHSPHISKIRGSSPRGRGKPTGSPVRPSLPGLIPAWAGKTGPRRVLWRVRRAHPRVGGENEHKTNPPKCCLGSSPRGRGKPRLGPLALAGLRLIPAWAGKTTTTHHTPSPSRAHPRVGGENARLGHSRERSGGSSPRGRGKQGHRPWQLTPPWLIPAWAGKTSSSRACQRPGQAHPRVGGENSLWFGTDASTGGSSPRGRGKPTSPHQW